MTLYTRPFAPPSCASPSEPPAVRRDAPQATPPRARPPGVHSPSSHGPDFSPVNLPATRLLAHIVIVFFALAMASTATAQSKADDCDAALETMKRKWKDPEETAWSRICRGNAADFDEKLNRDLVVSPDPKAGGQTDEALRQLNPDADTSKRRLSADFLRTIMTVRKFRKLLPDKAVRVTGAYFPKGIDLDDASLRHPLTIRGSVIKSSVSMENARAAKPIVLAEIVSSGALDLERTSLERGFTVKRSIFRRLDLESAVVHGNVELNESTFMSSIDLDRLEATGLLDIRGSDFRSVRLRRASIAEGVAIRNSTVSNRVDMNRTTTDGRMILKNLVVCGSTTLRFVAIEENLRIEDASIATMDLTGAQVGMTLELRTLRQSSRHENCPTGDETAKPAILILEDATAGTLQDTADTWPTELALELDGFKYRRFTRKKTDPSDTAAERSPEWFAAWLERDGSFAPQPYMHLARVMEAAGREDIAREVRFTRWERMRTESQPRHFRWWLLSALRITMGYGEGWGNLRALVWVALFSLIGTIVLRMSKEVCAPDKRLGFWYSLDMLLPVAQLDARHYEIQLTTWARYYFMVHKLLGYVLVFLVVAGLTAALTDIIQ